MNAIAASVRRTLLLIAALGLGACAESGYYTHTDARGDGVYYTADRHSRSRLYDDGSPSPYSWSIGFTSGLAGPWAYGYVGSPGYGGWWDPWFAAPVVYVYDLPSRDRGHWRHSPYGDQRDYAPRAAREQAERAASRMAPAKVGLDDGSGSRGRDWGGDRGREPRMRDDRGRRERD
jgi:hypothetical protein